MVITQKHPHSAKEHLNQPKICLLSASSLTIHFFLKPHLLRLSERFAVTLALNPKNDDYLSPLDLPVQTFPVAITRKISIWNDFLALLQLLNFFRKHHYELVITVVPKAGLLGMIAAYLTGVPRRLHIFQGEVWASKSGLSRMILKFADGLTARLATNLLAVSASERQFLIKEGVVPAGKIEVLGAGSISGVDLNKYCIKNWGEVKTVRLNLGIPEDAIVVIFLGRLNADKGIHEFSEACAGLVALCPKLWIILAGPDEEGILSEVLDEFGEIKSRVKICGYTPEPEKYLLASDFICLPSHREGFGMVIIEAAAMGLPAIGSRIYGISDAIIDNKTGILFDKGNVFQLRKAIIDLYSDESLRSELGMAAQRNASENYNQDEVVGRYVNYIEKLF